tara:strand:+ start:470 stop:808 length:339 start_codon:yes stop_codon:yes gene_type:complete
MRSNNMLDFNKYQIETRKTKIYSDDIIYPSLGLSGEVGELMNQIKKIYRDDNGKINFVRKQNLTKEIGDVMWYIARVADDLNIDLTEAVELNLKKLNSRMERGKIGGSGDYR